MARQTQRPHAGLDQQESTTDGDSQELRSRLPVEISRLHIGVLWLAATLAVLPGLPFIQSEAPAFVRLHDWAVFAGGVILGWALASARGSLG